MKHFRPLTAMCLALLFLFGAAFQCKPGGNDNNSNNSNNENSDNKNDNTGKPDKKPDVSKIPMPPSKRPEPEDAPDEPNTGGGNTIIFKTARAQMTIPSGWKGDDGNDRYIVSSPDQRLQVFFYVPADGNFDQAVDDVVGEMKRYLTNMKAEGKAKKVQLNGMSVTELSGDGEYEGKAVVWAIDAVQAPGSPLFVVSVADPKDFNPNKAGYQSLIQSIKPAR